ncbi:MAG: YhgE/Pip domain-containing protein [Coriobacteriia bacterium]|nr:YhgE/Pip domain-containing protein [Coriobacteriia bacterium]
MQSVQIARAEIKRLLGDRRVRMATVVITLVPLLYGALYLWAFWDPYQGLEDLPVALINEDQAVMVDGESLDAGAGLVDELLDRKTMGWDVVSAKTAQAGLEDGTYYLSLTIPAEFSADLATANSEDPTPAHLEVVEHESANLLASQIGNTVFSEVRAAAAANASEAYLDTIFLGFSEMNGSLTEAALGASDLASGLAGARDGANELASGLGTAHAGGVELSSGLSDLAAGAVTADAGAAQLDGGLGALSVGLSDADEGATSLSTGADYLATKTAALSAGLTQISDGSAYMASSASALNTGAAQLNAGVAQAATSVGTASSGAADVHSGTSAVVGLLQAYLAANPSAAGDATFAQALGYAQATDQGASDLQTGLESGVASFSALVAGAEQVADGASQLSDGAALLSQNVAEASTGASLLANGATSLSSGAVELAAGISTANSGATALSAGASALSAGTSDLAAGASLASSASGELVSGLALLDSGAAELAEGLTPAIDGSIELADGLTAGAADVPLYDDETRAANAAMMSDPVVLDVDAMDAVPNYGTGFSPYFIPLALWVGALMAFFIATPLPPKPIEERRNPVVVALAGFWPAALIGVAQAVVMLLVLQFGLGLEPRSALMLYGFTALSAVTFVAVLQWLSGAFGAIGKFLSIVLLMLQLTSSAGTFPLETAPGFFKAINPYLPMTYVVSGLRQAVSGGDWSAMGQSALVLGAFTIASLALTSITARRARTWDAERLKPALEI